MKTSDSPGKSLPLSYSFSWDHNPPESRSQSEAIIERIIHILSRKWSPRCIHWCLICSCPSQPPPSPRFQGHHTSLEFLLKQFCTSLYWICFSQHFCSLKHCHSQTQYLSSSKFLMIAFFFPKGLFLLPLVLLLRHRPPLQISWHGFLPVTDLGG